MSPRRELFGTTRGCIATLFGFGQLAVSQVGLRLAMAPRPAAIAQLTVWMGLVAALGVLNYVLWTLRPLPKPGAVTMERVHAARARLRARLT